MNRRNFLQTVAFTLVAAYSPISLPRAKPPVPLSSIFTPGIWTGTEGVEIETFEVKEAKPPFDPQAFVDWYFERPEVRLHLNEAVCREFMGLPPIPFEDPLYEERGL